MRILIAHEESHRSYGEALVSAVRDLRPCVEAKVIHRRGLEVMVEGFDPDLLVMCGLPNAVDPRGRAAWIRLSAEPSEPSEVCLGGRRFALENPGLEELVAIIDETGELVGRKGNVAGC